MIRLVVVLAALGVRDATEAYFAETLGDNSSGLLHKCKLVGRLASDEGNLTHDRHQSFFDASDPATWMSLSGAPCDVSFPPLPEPSCVVASVTVLPGRLAGFKTCLRSLLWQSRPPDRIYVILPWKLKDRLGLLRRKTFPDPLPRFLSDDPRVEVLRPSEDEDLATLNVLISPLRALRANPPPGCLPPHRIWVVNEDVEYDSRLLEALLACAARHPDAACGAEGGRGYFSALRHIPHEHYVQHVSRHMVPGGEIAVQFFTHFAGVLYRSDFFEEDFLTFPADADEIMLYENDFWFAGYLLSRRVKLLHLPVMRPWSRFLRSSMQSSLHLRWRLKGHNHAKDAAINYWSDRHGQWNRNCTGIEVIFPDTPCAFDIGSTTSRSEAFILEDYHNQLAKITKRR